MADPTNIRAMDEINFICGYQVEPVVASDFAIREAIDKYYGSAHALELKQVMEQAMAEKAAQKLKKNGVPAAVTTTLTRPQYWKKIWV